MAQAIGDARARGVYYLSDGRQHTWQDIGRLVGRLLGTKVTVVRVPLLLAILAAAVGETAASVGGKPPLISLGKIREFRQNSWVCLPVKATREFGFTPSVGIEEGMEETIRWYQDAGWLPGGR